jgi:hypothetical protein
MSGVSADWIRRIVRADTAQMASVAAFEDHRVTPPESTTVN